MAEDLASESEEKAIIIWNANDEALKRALSENTS